MEIINAYGTWLVLITAAFGFFMAFGIGANDVSNSMGTSVGSGTITAKQAIIIALIFESAGAYLAGGEVTETIKSGVIDPTQFVEMPDVLALGMLSALFASGAWLFIATKMGWPVSGTHTIIGALIGFACVTIGPSSVDWSTIGGIVGSWFITPVIAGLLAYTIFASIQKLIFDTEEPLKNAQKYGPYYMAITVFVLCIVTMAKGLKHVGLNLSNNETLVISLLISVVGMIFCHFYFRSKTFTAKARKGSFGSVEKIFSILMLLTACAMAFAHGSNDVANAIGPLSSVVSIVQNGGKIISGGDFSLVDSTFRCIRYRHWSYRNGAKSDGNRWIRYHRFNPKSWFCCAICNSDDCRCSIRYRSTYLHHTNFSRGYFRYWLRSWYCSA